MRAIGRHVRVGVWCAALEYARRPAREASPVVGRGSAGWLLRKLQSRREYDARNVLEASVGYRSCPRGRGMEEEEEEETREVRVFAEHVCLS